MNKNEGILGEMIEQLGESQALDQFSIRWDNTYMNSLGGHWGQYKYPAFGNILHWLHAFGSFEMAEQGIIGDGIVKLHGQFVASYEMDDELQRPVFKFTEKYDWLQSAQDLFAEGFQRLDITQPTIDKMKKIRSLWDKKTTSKISE